ncbi:MAG: cation diffusion facilitator family transporter [Candidatus Bathyarchaeia archaeon]
MDKKVKALTVAACSIASVVIVEFLLGFAVNSLAIMSDAAHALLDFVSILTLLFATRFSLKPPDEEHMYGHEKIEVFGGFIGGIILLFTAIFLVVEAIQRVLNGELLNLDWEIAGFAAIGYTFSMDVLRVKVLHPLEHDGATVKAGFYHAIADLGSTLIALFGFGLATLGFYYFDSFASIILCAVLGYLSTGLIKECFADLIDYAPRSVVKNVKEILDKSIGDASKVKKVKVRKAGNKILVEIVIKLPANMSVENAHTITSKAEEEIKSAFEKVEIITHVCPDSNSCSHY